MKVKVGTCGSPWRACWLDVALYSFLYPGERSGADERRRETTFARSGCVSCDPHRDGIFVFQRCFCGRCDFKFESFVARSSWGNRPPCAAFAAVVLNWRNAWFLRCHMATETLIAKPRTRTQQAMVKTWDSTDRPADGQRIMEQKTTDNCFKLDFESFFQYIG